MTAFRMADGSTMRQYCLKEGISYTIAYHRCDDLGMNPEEAVEEARHPHPKNRKHFIDGLSLHAFCNKMGLAYDSVLKLRTKKNLSVQEAVKYLLSRRTSIA